MNNLSAITQKILNKNYYKSRNGKILANLSLSLILKYIDVFISFVVVTITLKYLDKTRYGLWAALYSLLNWMFLFDIGIGNGLRNKITELKAKNKKEEIKNYVSTSYFIFGILALIFSIIFIIISRFLDWGKILNAPNYLKGELSLTINVIFFIMCINFVLRLINSILAADLKNAVSNIITVVSHFITLLCIIFLSKFTTPSILKYALLYVGSNVVITLMASIYLFKGLYKEYAPHIKYINILLWNDLISVGWKFFFISLSMNLMVSVNGLIISNLLGPEYVTDYSINMKYYSIASLLFVMLVQPLWTGYGDAYHRKDYEWIRKTFGYLQKLVVIMTGVLVLMIVAQKWIFRLWVGDKIQVDYQLSILFGLYYLFYMINNIYNPFINATSKIKLQMILYVFLSILYLIMAVLFVKYLNLGIKGILLSLVIFHDLPLAILMKIQSGKILNCVPGIWQK